MKKIEIIKEKKIIYLCDKCKGKLFFDPKKDKVIHREYGTFTSWAFGDIDMCSRCVFEIISQYGKND